MKFTLFVKKLVSWRTLFRFVCSLCTRMDTLCHVHFFFVKNLRIQTNEFSNWQVVFPQPSVNIRPLSFGLRPPESRNPDWRQDLSLIVWPLLCCYGDLACRTTGVFPRLACSFMLVIFLLRIKVFEWYTYSNETEILRRDVTLCEHKFIDGSSL
jgi:hypothetical protein